MTNPTIADAKALATQLRAPGVIVLAFDGEGYCGVSYGMTRAHCRALARTLDAIADGIRSGDIPVEMPEGKTRE